MRVFRVKLERSAADLGMPSASGLPPPSSWPDDYWVQTCSNTSWRVVQQTSSSRAVSLSCVVGKGMRFGALALVIIIIVVVVVAVAALCFAPAVLSCA